MSLFDDDAITVPGASPEGQEAEQEAVETPEQEQPEDVEQHESGDEQEQETEEDTPSGDEHPEQGDEKILGKFKSVDDLAKAYKSLERSFHQSRQPQQRQPATTQTPAPQPGGEEHPNDLVQRAFATDPVGTINYFVQQALAPYQEQRESESLTRNIESIGKQYAKQLGAEGGMQKYFDKIAEIAQDFGNPALVRNPSPRVLRMAAEELWGGETRQQVYDKAKAAGRQEAETTRQAKKGLQAPSGAKQQQQPVSEEEAIRQGILAAGRGGGSLLD